MIDWDKYQFKLNLEEGSYEREGFPFQIWEKDGFLTLSLGNEHIVSEGKIPATNQGVVLLLKSFNV